MASLCRPKGLRAFPQEFFLLGWELNKQTLPHGVIPRRIFCIFQCPFPIGE